MNYQPEPGRITLKKLPMTVAMQLQLYRNHFAFMRKKQETATYVR